MDWGNWYFLRSQSVNLANRILGIYAFSVRADNFSPHKIFYIIQKEPFSISQIARFYHSPRSQVQPGNECREVPPPVAQNGLSILLKVSSSVSSASGRFLIFQIQLKTT